MRNIFGSRPGRASIALAVAASTVLAAGASAEARPYKHSHHWHHWVPHYSWAPVRYYGYVPRYYGPRYYAPPPVVYSPEPTYYGPPAGFNLNFNIPLR